MNYSNNKWRKILIILSIINLCFILFAKITNVFGYTYYDEILATNIEVPDNVLNDRNIFYFIRTNVTGGLYSVYLIQYDKNATLSYQYDENAGLYYRNKFHITGKYVNTSYTEHSKQDCINFIKNMPSYTLTQTGNNTILTFGDNVFNDKTVYFSNNDIKYYNSNNIAFNDSVFHSPYFDNVTEIEKGYPDGVFISRGDYSENDALYFHLLKITNTVPDGNESTFYYNDKVFLLRKDTKYYRTYPNDTNNEYSYYYVKRSELTLDTDSSYLYVLSNDSDPITITYGTLQVDIPGGVYNVVESDTAGVITAQDSLNDKIANINNNQQEVANNSNNINNFLTENIISNETNNNINTNLDYNNQNQGLNNLNSGFFSRLTSMLSNLVGYNLSEDSTVSLPLPHSNKSIILHSKPIYDNVTGGLRLIINAFWLYTFSFYMWKFINKIYIAISTGNILDTFSSSGEAITNDML